MVCECMIFYTVDVPGQIEKQLQVIGCYLGIVNVGYPELAYVVLVGLTHLVIDKARLGGG